MARQGDEVDAARAAIGSAVMTLGVVPALDETTRRVAAGDEAAPSAAQLEIHRPDVSRPLSPNPADRQATYAAVEQFVSGDVLRNPGLIQLRLPDTVDLGTWSLESTEIGVGAFPPALDGADADRVVTWLRVRPGGGDGTAAGQADVRLAWLGANATMVVQRSHVAAESLGDGNGEPDQRVQLANRPVLLETLEVHVGGERWHRVDDLLSAAPEVPLGPAAGTTSPRDEQERLVYTVDPGEGWITFGTGVHGARPGSGKAITARYDFGGGRAGMLGAQAITKGPTLPPGVTVTNPVATWGGTEAASLEEAEATVPRFIRTRGQLVSAQDFREAAWQTPGIQLGRVDVLPLYFPGLEDVTVPGVVTLMVIPRTDPLHPDAPRPDRLFLDALCAHLSPRRLVTTELLLNGPDYKQVWISVGVDVERGRDIAPVLDAVKIPVREFLSPLPVPGTKPEGWPLRTAVDRLQVVTEVARVDGVDRVVDVVVASGGGPVESLPMIGLELPELVALSVSAGSAATVLPVAEPRRALLAVPFVPEEC
jgi:predicted phage baseplate assembly protein